VIFKEEMIGGRERVTVITLHLTSILSRAVSVVNVLIHNINNTGDSVYSDVLVIIDKLML